MIISVEGCIASGKSTTARMLARTLSYSVLLEDTAAHPILSRFYSQPADFGLETELIFLVLRFHWLMRVDRTDSLVTDFSFGTGLAFARMNLLGADLAVFEKLHSGLRERLIKPDLAVFLDVPVEILLRRIQRRGRPYEQGIAPAYLDSLRKSYLDNLTQFARSVRVVRVEPNDSPEGVAEKASLAVTSIHP